MGRELLPIRALGVQLVAKCHELQSLPDLGPTGGPQAVIRSVAGDADGANLRLGLLGLSPSLRQRGARPVVVGSGGTGASPAGGSNCNSWPWATSCCQFGLSV